MKRDFNEYIRNYKELNFEEVQEKYRAKRLKRLISELTEVHSFKNVLEIGPGKNSVYNVLTNVDYFLILEPIEYFYSINRMKSGFFDLRKETAEDFIASAPSVRFDLVVLSSVLHELEDPKNFLIELKKLIHEQSKVIVIVPNNLSLHRVLGEKKGFSKAGSVLTETEKRMQQRNSFSIDSLEQFSDSCGYFISEIFTSFIKPHPHFKMHSLLEDGTLSEADLDFFYSISKIMEPYGSEIFAVLEKIND